MTNQDQQPQQLPKERKIPLTLSEKIERLKKQHKYLELKFNKERRNIRIFYLIQYGRWQCKLNKKDIDDQQFRAEILAWYKADRELSKLKK